ILLRTKGQFIEPFVGAGAMFFAVAPRAASLSDLNEELINCFRQVRDRPETLLRRLRLIPVSKKAYYALRDSSPTTDTERAVRFIYLNRTCYGGLYRTNLKGEFNVPYGGGSRTPAVLWEQQLLQRSSSVLRRGVCDLRVGDFEQLLQYASKGDVVYCD